MPKKPTFFCATIIPAGCWCALLPPPPHVLRCVVVGGVNRVHDITTPTLWPCVCDKSWILVVALLCPIHLLYSRTISVSLWLELLEISTAVDILSHVVVVLSLRCVADNLRMVWHH